MNKRTLNRAARIYSLAIIAHMDAGGAENEEESEVCEVAARMAQAKLEAMGLSSTDVPTLQHCIALAKRLEA